MQYSPVSLFHNVMVSSVAQDPRAARVTLEVIKNQEQDVTFVVVGINEHPDSISYYIVVYTKEEWNSDRCLCRASMGGICKEICKE